MCIRPQSTLMISCRIQTRNKHGSDFHKALIKECTLCCEQICVKLQACSVLSFFIAPPMKPCMALTFTHPLLSADRLALRQPRIEPSQTCRCSCRCLDSAWKKWQHCKEKIHSFRNKKPKHDRFLFQTAGKSDAFYTFVKNVRSISMKAIQICLWSCIIMHCGK